MADRNAWDQARAREDPWRHPRFRRKLDANFAAHVLRVLMTLK
jgi:hypothetical protein